MRRVSALITMLVCLALTGGAQACAALCGAEAKLPASPVKSHGCCKGGEKSKVPAQEKPCPKCTAAKPLGVNVQKAITIDSPDLASVIDAVVDVNCATAQVAGQGVRWHGPPVERLHQFCLLLI